MNTNTTVQKPQKPFEVLKQFVESSEFQMQLKRACVKHLTPDRQSRIVLTAALSQPKIAEAFMEPQGKLSIIKAMLTASQRGLELDGRQGHLVPFNDKRLGMIVQFIPGYQGLIDLAYNHPKVKSIWWNVVYERDQFDMVDGLERRMQHLKYEGEDDPGALRYAYAVCEMDGGAKTFVCLNKREVNKARNSSRGSNSEYSPWNTHEAAMWGKTAVRALCKQIPQSAELRDVLTDDNENLTEEDRAFKNAKPVAEVPVFAKTPPAAIAEPDEIPGAEVPPLAQEPVRRKRTVTPATVPTVGLTEVGTAAQTATGAIPSNVQLASILDSRGVKFDDLCYWLGSTERDPKADTYTSVQDVPEEVAAKLVENNAADMVKFFNAYATKP